MKNLVRTLVPRPAASGPQAERGLLAVRAGSRLLPNARPDPETADGYLRLTAHVLVEASLKRFRTVGVVSARSGEGRTTAALNLAICLGRARGREGRVLLVDGDVRRGTLTGLVCGRGAGPRSRPGPAGARCIATQFEGVDFLAAPAGTDPLSLDAPDAWLRTFHELAERYACLVVDCPSLLDAPDGALLGECLDQLVLVVQAGRTPARTVRQAVERFQGRVLGVILNESHGGRRVRA